MEALNMQQLYLQNSMLDALMTTPSPRAPPNPPYDVSQRDTCELLQTRQLASDKESLTGSTLSKHRPTQKFRLRGSLDTSPLPSPRMDKTQPITPHMLNKIRFQQPNPIQTTPNEKRNADIAD
jgi:hypothetical protein